MREDQFQNLLRAADEGSNRVPFVPGELAARVRILHQKRRRNVRRIAIAAPLMLSAIAVAAWRIGIFIIAPSAVNRQVTNDRLDAQVASQTSPVEEVTSHQSETAGDMARLGAEADFHLRVARRIIALRQHDRSMAQAHDALAAQEPDGSAREQLDIVGYRMILRADALREAMRPGEEAVVIYQNVLRLFPTTSAARLARQRLADRGIFQGDI